MEPRGGIDGLEGEGGGLGGAGIGGGGGLGFGGLLGQGGGLGETGLGGGGLGCGGTINPIGNLTPESEIQPWDCPPATQSTLPSGDTSTRELY